jgi:hypothetical protein
MTQLTPSILPHKIVGSENSHIQNLVKRDIITNVFLDWLEKETLSDGLEGVNLVMEHLNTSSKTHWQ